MSNPSFHQLPFLNRSGTYIAAEAEINHNGDLPTALRMVEAAHQAGADAIKFQYVVADEIATPDSPYYALFKNAELSEAQFREIFAHASRTGIDCFITAPSLGTLEPVVRLKPRMIKVSSTNLTNIPLLRAIGQTGIPVLLSTGLGNLGEIETALDALAATPEHVGIFHCAVQYPAPAEILNLRAIQTMQAAFPGYAVGLSDHSLGLTAPIAAAALGARILEKHLTLDRKMEGPDHAFSTEPEEFARMVAAVRDATAALGDGAKRPSAAERPHVRGARRYLVAARAIARGARFTAEALAARRIAADRDGLEPGMLDRLVRWRAPRDYAVNEPVCWSDFDGNAAP